METFEHLEKLIAMEKWRSVADKIFRHQDGRRSIKRRFIVKIEIEVNIDISELPLYFTV